VTLFDLDFLRENTDGDTELEAELLTHFEGTITRCLTSLTAPDANWSEILHELKGAARTMGADALAEYCAEGEALSAPQPEYLEKMRVLSQQTLEAIHQSL
jgi:HPt (histidine-containing phosphotransfer) domain-containing protein